MVCDPVSWLAWFSPQGIVRAIKDFQGPLKEHEVTIFVRRGGPNYQEGLRVMGEVGEWDEAKVHREEHKVSQRTKELDYDYVMSFVILEIFGVKQFSYYVLDNNDQKEG